MASKREKRRLRKKVGCVETVALEACSCVEACERERNEGFVKRFGVWKQSLSRRAGFSKRANVREAACTSNRRSTLRKEKVIRRSWEVGLRGGKAGEETSEPLTVPAHTNGSTRLLMRLPEPGPSIWALSDEQARPGFVCWTVREIG